MYQVFILVLFPQKCSLPYSHFSILLILSRHLAHGPYYFSPCTFSLVFILKISLPFITALVSSADTLTGLLFINYSLETDPENQNPCALESILEKGQRV